MEETGEMERHQATAEPRPSLRLEVSVLLLTLELISLPSFRAMADWMKSWRLLILFGLLSLTDPFEVRGEEWEELSPDIAALHHLRGLSEHMFDGNIRNPPNHKPLVMEMLSPLHRDIDQNATSLLSDLQENEKFTASVIQEEQDFEGFLAEIDDQKTQDVLLSASEISHSYSQKLLVMTDKEQSTNDRVQQEYSMDPRYSVIVSNECLSNVSCVPEADSYTLVKRPQRPVDHSTRYDHQQILILEDDPAVRTAATYLFEKHPAVSSVYVLDNNQRPVLIRGDSVPLTEDSRLVLVGHGRKDNSGETRLGGYEVQEVSKIIQQASRDSNKIKTISVVACDVGSDEAFIETLLKDLHETAGIETKLHIRNAVIQVRHTGEKITQEISKDGEQWRHKDYSKKVVATLDRNGDVIIRSEPGSKGKEIFTTERNFLGPEERFQVYRKSWPDVPKRFINQNVYDGLSNDERVDGLENNELMTAVDKRKACDELEAMSWGFFHNEGIPPPRKINSGIDRDKYYLSKTTEVRNVEKLMANRKTHSATIQHILSNCYEIESGEDIRNVIRHYAKTGEDQDTYLKVNDWILKVKAKSLYVFLIGKKLDNNDIEHEQNVQKCIQDQIGKEKYPQIREGIITEMGQNEKEAQKRYAQYAEGIFRGEPTTTRLPLSAEAWSTRYFTASVISESARNFRTFPLTLMALDMVKSKDEGIKKKGLNFLWKDHSMARGDSWIDPSRRGFSGSADYERSSKLKNNEASTSKEPQEEPSTSKEPQEEPSTSKEPQKEPSKSLTREDLINHLKNLITREVQLYSRWIQNGENNPSKIFDIAENNYKITERNEVQDYNNFNTKVAKNSPPAQ